MMMTAAPHYATVWLSNKLAAQVSASVKDSAATTVKQWQNHHYHQLLFLFVKKLNIIVIKV